MAADIDDMSTFELPAIPEAARMARAFARDRFATFDDDMLDRITLCVSELVTNALDHASPPFHLRLGQSGGRLRIEVRDASERTPVPRDAAPTSLRGRGIHLVEQSSSTWGVDVERDGKSVWAEFETRFHRSSRAF